MARILVVDDDEVVLMLVQAQLRRNGHQVITAMSAQEALNSVTEKGAPDVVVLDVGLPDMDGLDLLQSLRDHLELPDLAGIFLMVTSRRRMSRRVGRSAPPISPSPLLLRPCSPLWNASSRKTKPGSTRPADSRQPASGRTGST